MSQGPPWGPGQGDARMNAFFSRHANHPVPVCVRCGRPPPRAGGVSPSGPAGLEVSGRVCGSRGFVAEQTSKAGRLDAGEAAGLLAEVGWGLTRCPLVPSRAALRGQGDAALWPSDGLISHTDVSTRPSPITQHPPRCPKSVLGLHVPFLGRRRRGQAELGICPLKHTKKYGNWSVHFKHAISY